MRAYDYGIQEGIRLSVSMVESANSSIYVVGQGFKRSQLAISCMEGLKSVAIRVVC